MAETQPDHYVPRMFARRKADRGINWAAIAWATTVAIWIIGALSGWFGTNAVEIKSINQRLGAVENTVQTLKEQRVEDMQRDEQQRQEIINRLNRQDDKLDELLRRIR